MVPENWEDNLIEKKHNANHIILSCCHLPVIFRSLAGPFGYPGSSKPQIYYIIVYIIIIIIVIIIIILLTMDMQYCWEIRNPKTFKVFFRSM